jgi:anti-sigma B factor antagonist
MTLNLTIEKLPEGTAVITLSGRVTNGDPLLRVDSQIRAAIANGVTRLVVDLTEVEYVDSAGLGLLLYTYGVLTEKKGALRLCGAGPRVQSMLKLTKSDTILAIDASREESLAALARA